MNTLSVISDVIMYAVLDIATMIFYLRFFQDNLRLKKSAACGLFALGIAVSLGVSMLTIGCSAVTGVLIGMLAELAYVFPIVFLVKRNWMNSMSLFHMFILLYNIIYVTVFGILNGIVGAATGEGSWFVKDQAGAGMLAAYFLCMVAAIVLAYFILKIFKNTVLDLKGARRIVLFIMMATSVAIDQLIKPWIVNGIEYRNNPEGIGMVLDVFNFALGIVAILWILIIHVKNNREKKKALSNEIKESAAGYEKAEELQSEIRELNHELNNLENMEKK